jgi:hypothetical protein
MSSRRSDQERSFLAGECSPQHDVLPILIGIGDRNGIDSGAYLELPQLFPLSTSSATNSPGLLAG